MKFTDLFIFGRKRFLLTALLFTLLLVIFLIRLSNFESPYKSVSVKYSFAPFLPHETEEVDTNIRSLQRTDSISSNPSITETTTSTKSATTEQTLESKNIQTGLYIYRWTEFCHERIDILKSWALFPYYPIQQYSVIPNLKINANPSGKYAERVFGYIKPPITGMYEFRASKKQHIEIWISPNESPENTIRVLDGENATQIMFEKDIYCYVEIFYTIPQKNQSTLIEWRLPGQQSFESIGAENLFRKPMLITKGTKPLQENLPHFHFKRFQKEATRPSLFKYSSLPNAELQLYEDCAYTPSFAIKQKMKALYQGVEEIKPMWLTIYPNDGTPFGNNNEGNGVVNVIEVNEVFDKFKVKLLERREEIESVKLANFEKQSDSIKGSRYLIETEITLRSDKERTFRFSYYVYSPNGGSFCHPSSLHIQFDAFVYIAVTVKNQGHWIRYFVENMERIYEVTRDERFGVIFVDFESDDIDVVELVRNSSLPNKHIITLQGPYSRSISLNRAIDYVKNNGDIIFTCDLQLDIPVDIIDVIRTHTFRGLSGYAPALFRLDCGYSIEVVSGKWELLGYGMISMFKADWKLIGGFDEVRYRYKWGGEDWELLDRILENGYFIERFRQPLFFHYFHERSKLWRR